MLRGLAGPKIYEYMFVLMYINIRSILQYTLTRFPSKSWDAGFGIHIGQIMFLALYFKLPSGVTVLDVTMIWRSNILMHCSENGEDLKQFVHPLV